MRQTLGFDSAYEEPNPFRRRLTGGAYTTPPTGTLMIADEPFDAVVRGGTGSTAAIRRELAALKAAKAAAEEKAKGLALKVHRRDRQLGELGLQPESLGLEDPYSD